MDTVPLAGSATPQATRIWTLHWRERDLGFHHHDQLEPSPGIRDLLDEIDRDPTAIFWG
jgi:Protein of unknown function (DUF3024)